MHSGIGGGDPRPTDWSDSTEAADYPANPDPAYAQPYPETYPAQYPSPTYYGQNYTGQNYTGPNYTGQNYTGGHVPTGQLPPHWQPGTGYPGAPPPPPPPHKSGRWLWIGAGAAIAVIAGLVLAYFVVSSSPPDSTVVAPLPENGSAETMPIPLPLPTQIPTELPTEVPTRLPAPTATREPGPTAPGETADPGVTETVVYAVTGEGRAINITYVDTGGVMQTEFNVALPWSKEVSLSAPAKNSASVAILNVGRDVTCSVTVDGAKVRQRTGRGLTICTGVA